jgi:type 1 glutamine amidotransferase
MMRTLTLAAVALATFAGAVCAADANPWATFPGKDGPGAGKHIVLVSGDEEYRSEETLTQLAKILSTHHGFKCTVLYAIDPKTGHINPNVTDNIPGLEQLKTADLLVLFVRWRTLPDEQLQHLIDYVESGQPIIGLRTATHAVKHTHTPKYAKYAWNSRVPGYEGGLGKQVLGETWVAHHGAHGKEGTRGIIAHGQQNHPILRGIRDGDIFGPTDVYTVNLPLPGDSTPLVLGQVTKTLEPDSEPVPGKKNDPMMPVAWTKTYQTESGKSARVFTTTMGASQDFASEGLRRLLVNACYWALGMEDKIPEQSQVDIVGTFEPRPFRNDGFAKGKTPADMMK